MFLIFLSLPFSAGATLGISPPEVEALSVLRNVEQEFSFRLSRRTDEADQPVKITVNKRGDYAHYIDCPTEVIMEAGVDAVDYYFKIVPTDAANGDYEVILSFLVIPMPVEGFGAEPQVGASVQIITGVNGVVKFTVDDEELVAYEIGEVRSGNTEVGQPLYVTLNVKNKGNVEWKPDKIELTFADIEDKTNVITEIISGEDIAVVKPGGEMITLEFSLDSELIEGAYLITAKVYYRNEIIEEVAANDFTVFSAGTLAQKGELVSAVVNKAVYGLGEKIKLDAIFKNTGKILVKSVLVTEIYKGDEYIDLIRGDEVYADMGEEINLSLVIDLDQIGEYKLSSSVKYGNKQTNPIENIITITEAVAVGTGKVLSFANSAIGIGLLVLVLLVVAVIIKIFRRKKAPIVSRSSTVEDLMKDDSLSNSDDQNT